MKRIYIKDLKEGDIIKIKSLEWYEENKQSDGDVYQEDNIFSSSMKKLCGTNVEISDLKDGDVTFLVKGRSEYFSDWMVEKIVIKNNIDIVKEQSKENVIVDCYTLEDCNRESNKDTLLSEINNLKSKLKAKDDELEIVQREVKELKNTLKLTNEESENLIKEIKFDLREEYSTRIERYEKIIDRIL